MAKQRTYIASYQTCIEDIQEFLGCVEDHAPQQRMCRLKKHEVGKSPVLMMKLRGANFAPPEANAASRGE
ncbi:MAG: hypothetical protein D6711_02610 [Chloroflexi bacterium]|nr:MAG: hypothetical protein D6711_02610 [Chloroflexota bacterium]